MSNKLRNIILVVLVSIGLGLGTNAAVKNTKAPAKKTIQPSITLQKAEQKTANSVYESANSLDIVANPAKYLNKRVKIVAKFDKFTTLGLDYKPAFRSSEKYIVFLIKRDDVTNHTVPLSELKNFIEREDAEKYIDLKPGDVIEYKGIVFSNALGDAWVNVEQFKVLEQKKIESSTKK